MHIYINWNNELKSIHLPINPESFIINNSMNNTSLIVHNLGEVNLKGKRGLYSISLSSFFPCQQYTFAMASYRDPYNYYIKNLKSLFENNTTVHLIITGTLINGFYTIESFEYGHEERTSNVSYTLELKEYRDISSKKQRSSKPAEKGAYTWRKGDTWARVCKKKLGTSRNWKKVRKANAKVIKIAKKKNKKKREGLALIGYKVIVK